MYVLVRRGGSWQKFEKRDRKRESEGVLLEVQNGGMSSTGLWYSQEVWWEVILADMKKMYIYL